MSSTFYMWAYTYCIIIGFVWESMHGDFFIVMVFIWSFQVHLYKESSLDSPVHSLTLGPSSFFYPPSLAMDNQVGYPWLLNEDVGILNVVIKTKDIFCLNWSFTDLHTQTDFVVGTELLWVCPSRGPVLRQCLLSSLHSSVWSSGNQSNIRPDHADMMDSSADSLQLSAICLWYQIKFTIIWLIFQRKLVDQELNPSSFLILPLTILILFVGYNYQQVSGNLFLLRWQIYIVAPRFHRVNLCTWYK